MIIGIEHGNAQIKTRNTCFVSGVDEFPTKPPMAADVIQYQSRYWTLVGKRLPVMRDKTKDDRFYLLTLFAISKELEARKEITSTLVSISPSDCLQSIMECSRTVSAAVFPQAGDGALHLQR